MIETVQDLFCHDNMMCLSERDSDSTSTRSSSNSAWTETENENETEYGYGDGTTTVSTITPPIAMNRTNEYRYSTSRNRKKKKKHPKSRVKAENGYSYPTTYPTPPPHGENMDGMSPRSLSQTRTHGPSSGPVRNVGSPQPPTAFQQYQPSMTSASGGGMVQNSLPRSRGGDLPSPIPRRRNEDMTVKSNYAFEGYYPDDDHTRAAYDSRQDRNLSSSYRGSIKMGRSRRHRSYESERRDPAVSKTKKHTSSSKRRGQYLTLPTASASANAIATAAATAATVIASATSTCVHDTTVGIAAANGNPKSQYSRRGYVNGTRSDYSIITDVNQSIHYKEMLLPTNTTATGSVTAYEQQERGRGRRQEQGLQRSRSTSQRPRGSSRRPRQSNHNHRRRSTSLPRQSNKKNNVHRRHSQYHLHGDSDGSDDHRPGLRTHRGRSRSVSRPRKTKQDTDNNSKSSSTCAVTKERGMTWTTSG